MEILLTGFTAFLTQEWIETAFPDDHVLTTHAKGEALLDTRIKTVMLESKQLLDQLSETYQFNRVFYFSEYLLSHSDQEGELDRLRWVLQSCREREVELLYLSGPEAALTPSSGKTLLANAAEELCFHYAKTSKLQVKVFRLPYLYAVSASGAEQFARLFEQISAGTVQMDEQAAQPLLALCTEELANLVARVFDTWTPEPERFTLPDVFGSTQGQLGEALQKLQPGLKVEQWLDVLRAIEQEGLWVNRGFLPGRPMYAAGVRQNGSLVVLIGLYTAGEEQMTLYYQNLFRILCGLVKTALVRAFAYESAVRENWYLPVTCLLLYDSGQEGTDLAKKQFDQILLDMKVSTQAVDVHTTSLTDIPEFDRYKTVVLLISDLDVLGKRLIDLMDWVRDGGNVLFAMSPQKTTYFDVISPELGVLSSSWEYKTAESIIPTEEFMLGGGQRYELSDPFESSLSVSLREEATVCARTGDEGVPLVWGTKSGAGRVVVDNIGVYDKIMRGIYAASFSLLCDAAAYPVINSSVFYLDDFPSPVPGGDGTYIRRDYRMSIADFYSNVWWPDLVKLAQQYSIRFTGVMIENYEDDTQSTPNRQPDTQQFRYYGSMLLQQGGKVGFHGYNHQPLVLPDTDYKDLYSYRQWPSEDAMAAAMNELISFQKTVLPNTEGSVYVPPSNILSAAGRKVLGSTVTQIRTITEQYIWQMPDMEHLPLTRTQYNTVAQALPEEIEENYQQYTEGYYYPMPFYIGTPSLQNGVLQLNWDPFYDFDAESITYTVELARDYQFRQVLYR